MKPMFIPRILAILFLAVGIGAAAVAEVPLTLTQQGFVTVNGAPFTGDGYFRFAIIDSVTGSNLWTNDGSAIGAVAQPTAALTLAVADGLYAAVLGDTAVAGMTAIPKEVFDSVGVAVRIWFDDGTNGVQQLTPDQTVTSAAYAIHALAAEDAATVGGVSASTLEESAEIDADIAAHTALPDAHHSKTVDASELTQGTLGDARLSANVTQLGPAIDLATETAGTLPEGQVEGTVARDTEVTSAVDTHRADANAHPNLSVDGAHITGTVPEAQIDAALARDSEAIGALTIHNDRPNAHAALELSAAQITAGTLANARLNMGAGGGLDADTLDGLQASAFMPITADNWVNTSGDTMSGASDSAVLIVTNTGAGSAVRGSTSGASSAVLTALSSGAPGWGLFAQATGAGAWAVDGRATNTGTGTNYGGSFSAAGTTGRAVYGKATNTAAATNYGGYFEAAGTAGIGALGQTATGSAGIRGENLSTATSGVHHGVFGSTDSTSPASAGVFGQGWIGVDGVANTTNGAGVRGSSTLANSNGVVGVATGTGSVGVKGSGVAYDFYAYGSSIGNINYGPFTGGHEVKLAQSFAAEFVPGLIVCTTGNTYVRRDEKGDVSLSSTLPTVRLADAPNDKTVFGVLVAETPLPPDHWFTPAEGDRFATANALGEGRVWVTNVNGDIASGDYITTSAVAGYGQRQDDDLLHSYTLGKAIEAVDWSAVTDTVTAGGQTVKAYLIAVVYTSG